jgi:O-antigen/teichoic acid export membrane protein
VSVVRQSSVILALGWLLTPVQFLTSAAVARAVGPEGRGVLFLLAAVTALLAVVTSFGVTAAAAVVYRRGVHPPGTVLGSVLALAAVSAGLVALAYLGLSQPFLALFFGATREVTANPLWVVLALAVVPFNTLVEVGDVLLIGEDAMGSYAARTSGSALVAVALTWLLTFVGGLGVTGVLLAQLLSVWFGLAVFVRWLRRHRRPLQLRCSRAAIADLLRVGVQQLGTSLVGFASKRLDAFIISRLLSLRDAGHYAVANSVQTLFVNVPRATVWPLVFSLSGQDPRRFEQLARSTRLLTLALGLGSALVIALAPWLVVLLFGPAFEPAITPVCWALSAVLATPLIVAGNALYTSRGQPARMIVASLPGAITQVALNFALVPSLGASGAAIALGANHLVAAAVQLVQLALDREAPPLRALLVPTREDFRTLRAAIRLRLGTR